jgi:hypothetical protein
MLLSDRIDAAIQAHAAAFPFGDWNAANEELGRLWYEAAPILRDASVSPHIGNNERASALRALGH